MEVCICVCVCVCGVNFFVITESLDVVKQSAQAMASLADNNGECLHLHVSIHSLIHSRKLSEYNQSVLIENGVVGTLLTLVTTQYVHFIFSLLVFVLLL